MINGQVFRAIKAGKGWIKIGSAANTGNFYRRIENRMADLTGNHIHLVRLGDRNQ